MYIKVLKVGLEAIAIELGLGLGRRIGGGWVDAQYESWVEIGKNVKKIYKKCKDSAEAEKIEEKV